ncbi:NUDIX hydrolase [Corynebacterium sp. ES2794-CONJ1]|uniref:NUDIX hydrolase n=1 Tax=unclassified Corynebacterium TaxID=2624378 RepID=UPI00216A5DD6|nr:MULTISPECIES: NUDIX hydrolase [unclassified Corynebacterium]MCS4490720.1 NUDIX hydrolase [Corynebacterium sp. ES2775-CONJ]MCS4492522.1 NUDIX hydrolase [Corynebacterium sp. ES2715-CONJ3]MCS4532623.1 NUDIX hydrolase [Corynebacterium sp. ES2730-CONJ]MCU9520018.1 NUDIX hydrolase [Corynebacterium sp. ES2794-CONJ1]
MSKLPSQQRHNPAHNPNPHRLERRFQKIPATPAAEFDSPVLAAGAVLWRHDRKGRVEFACIHRPHLNDWSLAKGKVDPGESLAMTAVREIAEETGYEIKLGELLGRISYPLKKRTKVVYYWLAEVIGGTFVANNEVDELRWVSDSAARKLLSYSADHQVLDAALTYLSQPTDSRLILIRHADTVSSSSWYGGSISRPLSPAGFKQATMLAPLIAAYHPDRLISVENKRCQATLEPASKALSLPLTAGSPHELPERDKTIASCLDKKALIGTMKKLEYSPHFHPPRARVKKAGMWVFSFHKGLVTSADYFVSPLAIT